jgi:hypothetical protein
VLEDEKEVYNRKQRKIAQVGCGDSSGLTSQFSELSLDKQRLDELHRCQRVGNFESTSLPSSSHTTSYIGTEPILSNDESEYQLESDELKYVVGPFHWPLRFIIVRSGARQSPPSPSSNNK